MPPIWRDDRVPDLSPVLTPGLKIDPAGFADWLAPLLAEYRSEAAVREALPARADELATADSIAAALEAAAAEWRALAPVLVDLGTLTAADLRALQLLCETL